MSSSEKLRLLLDSTYLLPIVGVDVEGIGEVMHILKKLRDKGIARYYYTEFNILEILGKLGRIKYDAERVAMGLLSIREEFKLIQPSVKGLLKALELKSKGYRDLIDLLLYVSALTNDVIFLTRDEHLIKFLRTAGEDIGNIVYEGEFIIKYG